MDKTPKLAHGRVQRGAVPGLLWGFLATSFQQRLEKGILIRG